MTNKVYIRYNPESRKRYWSKQAKSRGVKWNTRAENSRRVSTVFKNKKRDLHLRELDDEIRTVIVENVSQKIF